MSSRRKAENAAREATNDEFRRAEREKRADRDSRDAHATADTPGSDNDELAAPEPDAGPHSPTQLKRKGLVGALKRTVKQFSEDNISDWAAALTYYGVLSIFPGVLVLVSVLGLVGADGQAEIRHVMNQVAPSPQLQQLIGVVLNQVRDPGSAGFAAIFGILVAFWSASGYIGAFMRASNAIYDVPEASGVLAIVGLLTALWSASGYISAFMRAANAIYDVPEGRPIWKTLPIRIGVTAVIGVMMIVSAVIVVFTGDLARIAGNVIGLGPAAVTVWSILKWPVLVILVSLMFAILYWASPNARTGGFRWVSPGGVFAVLLWMIASAAFAIYLANFANYNKTYGTLGGVIAFLVWFWISNIAILLGAEFDAELERGRAIAAGHDPSDEPFLQLRDDRKLKKGSEQGLSEPEPTRSRS
jgi:membrane protein